MGEPIHCDFYIVAKDRLLQVEVPLEFTGIAPAEKLGGVVVKVMHALPIEALPAALPQHITVDLSLLVNLDSHISVSDLMLGAGVRATIAAHEVIASIIVPQEEKEETPMDLSAIEVEKKGKKEEEGDAAAGAEPAVKEEKKEKK